MGVTYDLARHRPSALEIPPVRWILHSDGKMARSQSARGGFRQTSIYSDFRIFTALYPILRRKREDAKHANQTNHAKKPMSCVVRLFRVLRVPDFKSRGV